MRWRRPGPEARRPHRGRRRLLALLLLTLAAPASADMAMRVAFLGRIDADGDGSIDLREYQAYLVRGFDALDIDGNGVLDLDEQPRGQRRVPISRAERLRQIEAAFRRQDRNRNGVLELDELTAPPAG